MTRAQLRLLVIAVLGAVFLLDVAKADDAGNYPVIRPGKTPAPRFCPKIYAPLCAVGCRTPMTTFANLCEAKRYAASRCEALLILHNGPCNCQHPRPKPRPCTCPHLPHPHYHHHHHEHPHYRRNVHHHHGHPHRHGHVAPH